MKRQTSKTSLKLSQLKSSLNSVKAGLRTLTDDVIDLDDDDDVGGGKGDKDVAKEMMASKAMVRMVIHVWSPVAILVNL